MYEGSVAKLAEVTKVLGLVRAFRARDFFQAGSIGIPAETADTGENVFRPGES